MVNRETLEVKIKGLSDKIEKKVKELELLQEEFLAHQDILLGMDKSVAKVECPQCMAKGYVQQGESKIFCKPCNGKGYLWMKLFTGGGL